LVRHKEGIAQIGADAYTDAKAVDATGNVYLAWKFAGVIHALLFDFD